MSDINLNGNYCDSRDAYMRDIDEEDVLIGAAAIGAVAVIAIGAVAFAVKTIAKSGGEAITAAIRLPKDIEYRISSQKRFSQPSRHGMRGEPLPTFSV